MVACTIRQPEDIKKQIKDLIKYYITQDNTIIIVYFQQEVDIIKEYDKNGDGVY